MGIMVVNISLLNEDEIFTRLIRSKVKILIIEIF